MFSVSGIFFACFVNIFRFDDIFYFWWFFLSFFANSFWQQADMDCISTKKNISFCICLSKVGRFMIRNLLVFLYLRVHFNWFRNVSGIIFKFCPLQEVINWEISKKYHQLPFVQSNFFLDSHFQIIFSLEGYLLSIQVHIVFFFVHFS